MSKYTALVASLSLWVGSIFLISLIVTEWRINELRPHVKAQGIREGVESGIETYKREYIAGEVLTHKKRKARDAAISRYIKNLDKIMEQGFK